jgi:hypothetical protein
MDPSNLRKAAITRGYQELPEQRRDYFAQLFAKVADEAARQLLERLEAGADLSPKELGVVAGIAADKVAAAEGWTRQQGGDAGDWLAAITERLKGSETVRLEVSKLPDPIDVTPSMPDPDSTPGLELAASEPASETELKQDDS